MHFKIHQVIKIPPEKDDSLEVNETTTIYPDLSDEEEIKSRKENTFSYEPQAPAQSGTGHCPIDAENCYFERFREGNKQNTRFQFPKIPANLPKPSFIDSEVKDSWFRQPSVKTSSSTSYINIQSNSNTAPSQNTVNKNCEELPEDSRKFDRHGSNTKSYLRDPVKSKISPNHLRFDQPCSSQSIASSKCKSLTDLQDLERIRKIKNCYIKNYNDILAVLFDTSKNSSRNRKSANSAQNIFDTPSHRLQGGKSNFVFDCQASTDKTSLYSEEDLDIQVVSYLEEELGRGSTDSLNNLDNNPELGRRGCRKYCRCKGNKSTRTDSCQCRSETTDKDYRTKSCFKESKQFKEEDRPDLERYFWKLKDLEFRYPETSSRQPNYQNHSAESGRSFDDRRRALDWDEPEKKYRSYNSLRNHCDSFTLLCSSRSKRRQPVYRTNRGVEAFTQDLLIEDPRCIALLIPQGCSLVQAIPRISSEVQTSDCVNLSSNFMRSRSQTSEKSTGTDQIGVICEVLSRSNTSIDSQGRLRSGKSGNIFNIFKKGSSKRRKESRESDEAEEPSTSRIGKREKRLKSSKEDSDPRPSSRPESSDSRRKTRRERLGKESICPRICQDDRNEKPRSRSSKRKQESFQDLPTREICAAFVDAAKHKQTTNTPCPETCPKKTKKRQAPKNKSDSTTVDQQSFIGQTSSGIPIHIRVTKSASQTESGTTEIKCVTKKINSPYSPTQQVVFTKKTSHGESTSCSGPTQKKSVTKKEVSNRTDTGDLKKEVTVVTELTTECCADKTEYKYVNKETSNDSKVTQQSSKLCSVIQPNLDVRESNNRFYCPDTCKSPNQTKEDILYQISNTPIFVKASEQSNQNPYQNPCTSAIQESLSPINFKPDCVRPKSQPVYQNKACENPVCEENLQGTSRKTPIQNQKYSSSTRRTTKQVSKKSSETCANPVCNGEYLRQKLVELLATTGRHDVSQINSPISVNPTTSCQEKPPETCSTNQTFRSGSTASKRSSHRASRKNSEACINTDCEGSFQRTDRGALGEAVSKDFLRTVALTYERLKKKESQNQSSSRKTFRGYQKNNSAKSLLADDNFLQSVSAAYSLLDENQTPGLRTNSNISSNTYSVSRKNSELPKEFVSDVDFIQSVAATYLIEKKNNSQGSKINQKKKSNSSYFNNLTNDEDFSHSVADTYAILNAKESSGVKTNQGAKAYKKFAKSTPKNIDLATDEDFLQSVDDAYALLNEKKSSGFKSNQSSSKHTYKSSDLAPDDDFLQSVADTYALLNEKKSSSKNKHANFVTEDNIREYVEPLNTNDNSPTSSTFSFRSLDSHALPKNPRGDLKRPEINQNQSFNQKNSQQSSVSANTTGKESLQKKPSGITFNQSCSEKYKPKSSDRIRNQPCGPQRSSEIQRIQNLQQKYNKKFTDTCNNQNCEANLLKRSPATSQKQSFNELYKEICSNIFSAEEQRRLPESCQNQSFDQNPREFYQNQVCAEDLQRRQAETCQNQSFNQKPREVNQNQVCGENFSKKSPESCQDQSYNLKYNQIFSQNQVCGQGFQRRQPETCQDQSFNQKSSERHRSDICGEDFQRRQPETCQDQSFSQRLNQNSTSRYKTEVCGQDFQKRQPETCQGQSLNQISTELYIGEVFVEDVQRRQPETCQDQSFSPKYNQNSTPSYKTEVCGQDFQRRQPETCQDQKSSERFRSEVCGEDLQRRQPKTCQDQSFSPKYNQTSNYKTEICGENLQKGPDTPRTHQRHRSGEICQNPKCGEEIVETCPSKGNTSGRNSPDSRFSPRASSTRLERSDGRRSCPERNLDRGSRTSVCRGSSRKARLYKESPCGTPRGRSPSETSQRRSPCSTPRKTSSERFSPRHSSTFIEESNNYCEERADRKFTCDCKEYLEKRYGLVDKYDSDRDKKPAKKDKDKFERGIRSKRSGKKGSKHSLKPKKSDSSTERRRTSRRDRLLGSKRSDASVQSGKSRGSVRRTSRRDRILGSKQSDSSVRSGKSKGSIKRTSRRERILGNKDSKGSIKSKSPNQSRTSLASGRKVKYKEGKPDKASKKSDKTSENLDKKPKKFLGLKRGLQRSSKAVRRSDSSLNQSSNKPKTKRSDTSVSSTASSKSAKRPKIIYISSVHSFCKVCPPEKDTRHRKREDCLLHRKLIKGKFGYTDSGCSICSEVSNCSISSTKRRSSQRKRSDNSINRSKQRQLYQGRDTDSRDTEVEKYTTERTLLVCPPTCEETPQRESSRRASPKVSPICTPRKRSPLADQSRGRTSSPTGSRVSICSTPCKESASPKISSTQISCQQSDIYLNQKDKYHYSPEERAQICSTRVCGSSKGSSSPRSINLESYLYADPDISVRRGRSRKVYDPKVAKSKGCAANLGRRDSGLLRRRDSPCSYSSRYHSNRGTPTFPYPSTSRDRSAGRIHSKVSPRISSSYYTKGTDRCVCSGTSHYKSHVKNTSEGYKKGCQSPLRARIPPHQLARRPSSAVTPRIKRESFTTDIFQCSFCPEKYQQSNLNRSSNTSVCSNDFNINYRRKSFSPTGSPKSRVRPRSPSHSVVYYRNKPGSLNFSLKEIEGAFCPPRTITFKSLTDFNESKEELHALRESNLHPYPYTCSVGCQSRSAKTSNKGNLTDNPYKPTWNDLLSYCDNISKSRHRREGYYRDRFCSQPPLSDRVRAVIKKLERSTLNFDSDCESNSNSESCFCGTSEQDLREFDDNMSDRIVFPKWNSPEPGPGLLRYHNRLSGILCPNEHEPNICDCAPSRGYDEREDDFRPSKSAKTRSKRSHACYGLCPNSAGQDCNCMQEFARGETCLEKERERVRKERNVSLDKTYNKPICPPERPPSQRLSFLDDPPYCSMSSFQSDVNFQKIKSLYKTSHEQFKPSTRKTNSEYYCRNALPHWVNRDQ